MPPVLVCPACGKRALVVDWTALGLFRRRCPHCGQDFDVDEIPMRMGLSEQPD